MTYRAVCTRVPFCLLLLLGLLVVGVRPTQAQPECPFTEDDAVADTLDPTGYYPLEVGNVWEYVVMDGAFLDDPRRERVIADTLIEDMIFYKLKTTVFDYEHSQEITDSTTRFEYVAVVDSGMVEWRNGSQSFVETRFNQPFDSCYEVDGVGLVVVSGGYEATFSIEEEGEETFLELPATKVFESTFAAEEYGHGIGMLIGVGDPSVRAELTYAKVGDNEFGTSLDSLFTIRVSTDQSSSVPPFHINLESYPNPSSETVHISFSIPETGTVTLTLVDLIGRTIAHPIRDENLPVGTHTAVWKAGSAPSGMYAVRLSLNGQHVAETTLTLIR